MGPRSRLGSNWDAFAFSSRLWKFVSKSFCKFLKVPPCFLEDLWILVGKHADSVFSHRLCTQWTDRKSPNNFRFARDIKEREPQNGFLARGRSGAQARACHL